MICDFDIKGKVAVVTGGGGVLCSVICKGLAEAGAKVAVMSTTESTVQKVAEEITEGGGEAFAVPVDVLDKQSLIKARDAVMERYGTVDILVNGAGGNKTEATTSRTLSFFELPQEALQWVFDLNVLGAVMATQVFGKIFAEKGSGSIVNISSIASFTPLTRTLAYSSAKAAVNSFTQWMATHMNQEYSGNIRVNAIAPGFFLTKQNEYLLIDKEKGGPTERGASVIAATPMGRYGDPAELVGAVIFLCSPAASYINGATLTVDGGFTAFNGV